MGCTSDRESAGMMVFLGTRRSGDGAGGTGRRTGLGTDSPDSSVGKHCSPQAEVRGCSLSSKSMCHTKS